MAFTLASFLAIAAILLGPAVSAIVPGTYVVELAQGQDSTSLASAIQPHGQVSGEMTLGSFRWARLTLHDTADKLVAELSGHSSVENIWPMNRYKIQYEKPTQLVPINATIHSATKLQQRRSQDRHANPPHFMTQVDKLQRSGVTGKGIKIAIIDSGIDYNHPAFGEGCLGPGCLIESYYNFSPDTCAPNHLDVMDCNGHGTHMAGIIAAQQNPLGFVGASPGAKLGIYRLTVEDADDFQVMQAISRAVSDGASIVAMSFGENGNPFMQNPLSRAIDGIAKTGVACIAAHGNGGQKGLFYGIGPPDSHGAAAVASFVNIRTPRLIMLRKSKLGGVRYENNLQTGGAVAASSAWGPTMDMDVKPQFGAPGANVLSTFPLLLGGYAVHSGTSFASPLIAAIYALLGELHGGEVKPKLFEQLLSATALPQLFHDGDRFLPGQLAPVPQQGAGLVRAFDAALATSILSPASLSFNDSDSSLGTLAFTISNRGPVLRRCFQPLRKITYKVHYVPAVTVYTLARTSGDTVGFPNSTVRTTAKLRFSQTSVTLSRGQSTTIYVSCFVPNMDIRRLPVWSGYITVNGSDGSALSIPYQGLAGSLRRTTVLWPGESYLVNSKGNRIALPDIVFPLPHRLPASEERRPFAVWAPHLAANLSFASSRVAVFVTPLGRDLDQGSTSIHSLNMFEIIDSPFTWLARGWRLVMADGWDGRLRNGSYAAAGTYRFVTKALRVRGDEGNDFDYDTDVTQVFTIKYFRIW